MAKREKELASRECEQYFLLAEPPVQSSLHGSPPHSVEHDEQVLSSDQSS
jgi:hypothetical protein